MHDGSVVLSQETTGSDTFDQVFTLHHDYVYRLALALLGHAQDAEDVTQEVFLRVYKGLPAYQPERAALRTWLTQIVVNACRTQRRRGVWYRFRPAGSGEAQEAALAALADPGSWGAPEPAAQQSELRAAVRAVLAGLRLEHRTVLVLHYYLDLSCPEIAQMLGCAEGTIYSRLHYARRRVQVAWEQRLPGEGAT